MKFVPLRIVIPSRLQPRLRGENERGICFLCGSCTTGGQVYCSADAGDSWNPIMWDLPTVLSVEVQTLG
jgi:hypothetical protein